MHMHPCIRACVNACMGVCVCTRTRTYVRTYGHVYVCMRVCMSVCMSTCAYVLAADDMTWLELLPKHSPGLAQVLEATAIAQPAVISQWASLPDQNKQPGAKGHRGRKQRWLDPKPSPMARYEKLPTFSPRKLAKLTLLVEQSTPQPRFAQPTETTMDGYAPLRAAVSMLPMTAEILAFS